MKAWLLAVISGKIEPTMLTFNSNSTWVATGVTLLSSVSGKGQDGQPEDQEFVEQHTYQFIGYRTRRSDGQVVEFPGPLEYRSGPAPGTSCTGKVATPSDPVYSDSWSCNVYADASYWETIPATTGAAASAFGKTFPGGAGVPATVTKFNDVPVTLGATYSIVVPAGGSITIIFYR